MVAAVAALEPEMQANIAQAAMLLWRRPPGSGFNHFASVAYIPSVTPERSRTSPIRMNNGRATSVNEVVVFQGT